MANIPGVSGYIQPGVFARDRVVSRGVSIPGGLRIATIMGFGSSEITLVSSAKGEGQDGVLSPNGAAVNGRFFLIPSAPLQEGRTRVFLNGSELLGLEGTFTSSDEIPSGYDFKLDPSTGYLGLQSASIKDQDGKGYSAASTNIGTGVIEEGAVGTLNELEVLDENAPNERWTMRCISVQKDSTGAPIKGGATFSVTGSVSGQSKDSSGNSVLFSDTYKSGTVAQVYANQDMVTEGYLVGLGSERQTTTEGIAKLLSEDTISSGALKVLIPLTGTGVDTSSLQGKLIVGDFFSNATPNVYVSDAYKITSIEIDFTNDYIVFDLETPITRKDGADISFSGSITVNGKVYNSLAAISGNDWSLRARDVIALNAPTEDVTSEDVEKLVLISGDYEARYKLDALTLPKYDEASFNILRVSSYETPAEGLPTIASDVTGLDYSLVETNDVISAAINYGDQAFAVGDKFFIDVFSRSLQVDDSLSVKTIIKANINDPELISEPADLAAKHGFASLENNLSLGAALAYENGAPAVLAIQCKPSVPRKTDELLLSKRNSDGEGGFSKSASGTYDVDDLFFPMSEVLTGGYRLGKPDADTQVKIFILRGEDEIELFPNKVDFYNSQFDDDTGKDSFIDDDTTYGFSYTIAKTGSDIDGEGDDGAITNEGSIYTFSTSEYNFDNADIGKKIVIRSLTKSDGNVINTAADIDVYLGTTGATLTISAISSDSKVTFSETVSAEATSVQFFIEDDSSSERQFGLLLNKSIVNSGSIQDGDGIKVSYIDENDADFFDTNWFQSFEKLEASNTQIIIPLPTQTISNIFRAAVSHCELMSSITNRKERVAYIGAQQGITPAALIGTELIAVENIGILEGIQGDDPEEILNGDTEDLANYKLNDNYTTERSVYFYPDQIVRNINGSNTIIDGFYLAAAAAGYTSATTNVATPLTNKTLIGFNILRDKVFKDLTLNQLGSVGATVVQPILGGGRILAGRTTSTSGFIEDEEISIIFIRDRVKQVMRDSLQTYIGRVQDSATNTLMLTRITSIMSGLVSQGIIESYTNVSVERDKVDPRQINVFLRFVPTFPINFVFIDIEVGIS